MELNVSKSELNQVWQALYKDLHGKDAAYQAKKFKELSQLKGVSGNTDTALSIVQKMINSCRSENEFLNAMESNEVPAIKLTKAEMELIKGGGQDDIGYIIGHKLGGWVRTAWDFYFG